MEPLLATLLGTGVMVGTGVMAVFGRAWHRNKKRLQLHGWVQEQQLDALGQDSWIGEYDERWLHVRLRFDCLELALRFWPELGLGLYINGRSPKGSSRATGGWQQQPLDEPPALPLHQALNSTGWLDIAKGIHGAARDNKQLAQLLSTDVRKALRRTTAACESIAMNDAQLLMRLPRDATPKMMRRALRRGSLLMAAIDRAREQVAPSPALQPLLPHWQRIAEDHGLTLTRIPLSLAGIVRGRRAMASIALPPQGSTGPASLDITVWFEQPLGETFELRPMAGEHRSFEAAYPDAGDPPCVTQLDDSVRQRMLRLLRKRGALTLNARYLWLRCHTLPAPERILPLLQRMVDLARDIEDCVHELPAVTGYRRTGLIEQTSPR